ncbi:hypothetical protein C366_04809 [Cryptococcus neoformans Tu401-1]|nr:hypothetical protein C365_04522 [Cryptococcus neoformans var. grubii Bt85]OXG14766.1 hypothetical protein C366_04809 [Cryptococcus neoformans var. grubii Tu401-1]OXM77855.1 hypothetical protein C364_04795 [Cryptococcus neoformans var. grubii Bt63]
MQASSHHFTSLTEQTNRGSSQPSQSPTIASTSYRPSRDHLWVWSCHPSTQPDAAASTLNEFYLLSQMSAYEVAYHNPLFQLDANLPADHQQRNVPWMNALIAPLSPPLSTQCRKYNQANNMRRLHQYMIGDCLLVLVDPKIQAVQGQGQGQG